VGIDVIAKEYRDDEFGVLRLKADGVTWDGKFQYGDRQLPCQLRCASAEALKPKIQFARALVTQLRESPVLFEEAICSALHGVYNSIWRLPDDPILSAEDFLSNFRLEGLLIERLGMGGIGKTDALGTAVYDPDWLFGDHGVAVYVDGQLQPFHVDLM
jgi:hypothetical protein